MCGGGGNFINKVQDFAPLRDTFGDGIDYAISPLLSGNQTALGGTQAVPGSYAEGLYKKTGYDQMQPAVDMFGKAIGGSVLGGYLSGASAAGGEAGAAGGGVSGTSEAGTLGGGADTLQSAPAAGGGDTQFFGDIPTDPNAGAAAAGGEAGTALPPAQALNPEALQAMGLQQVSPGVYTQGGAPTSFTVPLQNQPAQQAPGGQPQPQQPAQPGQPAASGQAPGTTDQQQLPGQQPPQGQQTGTQNTQQQGPVQKILEAMKNNPLGTTSVALLGANALAAKKAQQGQGPGGQAMQQQSQISQQAQQQAQQLLAQYQSGTLSAGQQAQLDQLSQNTKNQLRQYFASIGQSDSTAAVQSLAQVDQQALQMKQQMLDNALAQGLQALGIASGPLNSVAQYQLGQDKELRTAFGNFAQQLGTVFGRSSATTQPTGAATGETTTQPTSNVQSGASILPQDGRPTG